MSKIYVDEIAGIASPSTVAIPGHVIQVVNATTNTESTNASTSHAATGLSASITPTSTSSKILVVVNQGVMVRKNDRSGGSDITLQRNSSDIYAHGNGSGYGSSYKDINVASITSMEIILSVHFSYLDSPASTSALTYSTTGRAQSTTNGGSVIFQPYNGGSTITLMEIAG